MKVVYLQRHGGIASRTPEGWESAVIAAGADGKYRAEDLAEVADADFLVVGLEPVDETVLAAADKVKLIQRLGAGYDNIDLRAAVQRGIAVCNMPDFNAATVAEHAIMMMLALLRRVFDSTLLMKSTQWPAAALAARGLHDLRGKILGILGCGGIGREVARRACAFDVEILYHDHRRLVAADEKAFGARRVTLEELLERSDVLTCHLPHTRESEGMIGRAELGRMKRTAVIVNTARGAIIDEEALADALEEGAIAGAGLDVFRDEPLAPRHRLRRCPNVLLTPHLAGQTREAMDRMVTMMLENLHRVARGEEPRHRVLPED